MKCCIVGKFESFHRGHQTLIEEAKKECRKILIISIKRWENGLFSDEERQLIARNLGVGLINLEFDRIKNLSPEEFFLKLKEFGCRKLFAGEDWHFGRGRSGDITTARELGRKLGIEVRAIPIKKIKDEKIGTSKVRELLNEGKLPEANYLLGFNYFCIGRVEEGNKLGREIGFPTLNVKCEKVLPLPDGVYEVVVTIDGKRFKGIANLGKRPTVNKLPRRTLEIHVPDTQLPELYGKEIKVEFLQFLRPEKRFNSIEELKNQIKLDLENLKQYWRSKVGRAKSKL